MYDTVDALQVYYDKKAKEIEDLRKVINEMSLKTKTTNIAYRGPVPTQRQTSGKLGHTTARCYKGLDLNRVPMQANYTGNKLIKLKIGRKKSRKNKT